MGRVNLPGTDRISSRVTTTGRRSGQSTDRRSLLIQARARPRRLRGVDHALRGFGPGRPAARRDSLRPNAGIHKRLVVRLAPDSSPPASKWPALRRGSPAIVRAKRHTPAWISTRTALLPEAPQVLKRGMPRRHIRPVPIPPGDHRSSRKHLGRFEELTPWTEALQEKAPREDRTS